jgi:hypothetical protein
VAGSEHPPLFERKLLTPVDRRARVAHASASEPNGRAAGKSIPAARLSSLMKNTIGPVNADVDSTGTAPERRSARKYMSAKNLWFREAAFQESAKNTCNSGGGSVDTAKGRKVVLHRVVSRRG